MDEHKDDAIIVEEKVENIKILLDSTRETFISKLKCEAQITDLNIKMEKLISDSCIQTKNDVMKNLRNVEKEHIIPELCGPIEGEFQFQNFSAFISSFYEKTE